jgi:hypothetical protein
MNYNPNIQTQLLCLFFSFIILYLALVPSTIRSRTLTRSATRRGEGGIEVGSRNTLLK